MQVCNVDLRVVPFILSVLLFLPLSCRVSILVSCCFLYCSRFMIIPSSPWCIRVSSYVLVTTVMPYVSAEFLNSPFISAVSNIISCLWYLSSFQNEPNVAYLPHARNVEPQKQPFVSNTRVQQRKMCRRGRML
jgi:hypothetical protein